MEQILAFIQQHGLPVFVIATCIIALLGILKLCKVFNKVTNKNVKKFIYYILDVALSFGGSAIYFAIFHKSFNTYLVFSVAQISATTTLYAVYENFGVRKLVQIAIEWISKLLKGNNALSKLGKKLGLTSEVVDKLESELFPAEATKQDKKQATAVVKEVTKQITEEQKTKEKAEKAVKAQTVAEDKTKADAEFNAKVDALKTQILNIKK